MDFDFESLKVHFEPNNTDPLARHSGSLSLSLLAASSLGHGWNVLGDDREKLLCVCPLSPLGVCGLAGCCAEQPSCPLQEPVGGSLGLSSPEHWREKN